MELRNYPKPNIYLYNYQTETAISLATKKHEKNNYDMQLFKCLASNAIKTKVLI